MGLGLRRRALHPSSAGPTLILLDTNALLWLQSRHPRSRPLSRWADSLSISPASLLKIQFLLEAQRIRLRPGMSIADVGTDSRWQLDDVPALAWFTAALDIAWTRDPFDRLLVAHSRYRGWKLATGDGELIERLGPNETLEL